MDTNSQGYERMVDSCGSAGSAEEQHWNLDRKMKGDIWLSPGIYEMIMFHKIKQNSSIMIALAS